MKIRTSETSKYYEEWIYHVDALPDDFEDMAADEKYEWLSFNCQDATRLSAEPCEYEIGTVDEYEIVTE